MKTFACALAALLLAACGFEPLGGETTLLPVTKRPADRVGLATIENGLAYDGCSFLITVDGAGYAASASTKPLVESIATKIGTTRANITFRLTGGTATVACGRTTRTLPEIEVLALSPTNDVLSATATIENGLPYDGCSFPITIDKTEYAPSAASRALVRSIAEKKIGSTKVSLTYRLLGSMGSVECGWGSTQTLPEIEVLSLSLLASTANVIIHNDLPADGCSYPIELDGVRYAPSAASAGLVEAFATKFGQNPATIDYELTGQTGQVKCGWGSSQSLPELHVLAIRPRS